MEIQTKQNDLMFNANTAGAHFTKEINYLQQAFSNEGTDNVLKILKDFDIFFKPNLLTKLVALTNKKSFLVFKDNKYINVSTENIAYFYVKYNTSILVSFDKQEYFVNYSLEQIQQLLSKIDFFRLNRQYLVSFNAVKEVEHYFARKLLVNLTIPPKEKLLVSKEKVSIFLHWLDNR
jgi:DNA-binding LytR/AlgR family response regulator